MREWPEEVLLYTSAWYLYNINVQFIDYMACVAEVSCE